MPQLGIQIFVSSPGDVAPERFLTEKVIARLQNAYRAVCQLQPIFWEHEPLTADRSFQEGMVSPRETDIVICILWSRLGTRLPRHVTGNRLTGTEYEFVEAMEGRKLTGRPDILVYRKQARPIADLSDKQRRTEALSQIEALEDFIERWFKDEEGALVGAYHPFTKADEFEEHVEFHLRKLIDRRLSAAGISPEDGAALAATWNAGSPFRGLNFFDVEHEPIFFGRTKAIGDVVDRMKRQAEGGRAFLAIMGRSGCGKSSLVRAGVLPALSRPGVIEGVGLCRRAILRPSDSGEAGDIFQAMASALMVKEALPELAADGTTAAQLARSLRGNPAAAPALIKGAMSQAAARLVTDDAEGPQPGARLLFVVDRLEELFTVQAVVPADRRQFAQVLHALACDPLSRTWVLATLRSDFYAPFVAIPEFAEMKEGMGQYDLQPPTGGEISQLIREPVAAAALRCEINPAGERLEDLLRDEALQDPSVLPVLEFTLDTLYDRRDDRNRLTFAAYQALGGVKGALAQRAEETFDRLTPEERSELPAVFRQLVALGTLSDETPTRRQAPQAMFESAGARMRFVKAFIAARLLVSDQSADGTSTVRITHESLLTHWRRLVTWLADNRELLRIKARVEAATARWKQEDERADLLLPAGKLLHEAEQLVDAGFELDAATIRLIAASRRRARNNRRLRQTAVAALCALMIGVSAFAVFAWHQHNKAARLADEKGKLADEKGQLAEENGNLAKRNLAFGLSNQKLAEERKGLLDRERAQRTALEWQLHASDIERVRRYAQEGNGPQAQALLTAVPPDKQGWETAYLAGYLFGNQTTFRTVGPASRAVFTPDGRYLLVGQGDRLGPLRLAQERPKARTGIRMWDTLSGREISRFTTPAIRLSALYCLPDATSIIAVDESAGAVVYDLASGRELRRFGGKAGVFGSSPGDRGVALSPDGSLLATGDKPGMVRLWRVATGEEVGQIPLLSTSRDEHAHCLAFAPDGNRLAGGLKDGVARVWDVRTKSALTLLGLGGVSVNDLAWGADGTYVIGACDFGQLKRWDAVSGKELQSQLSHGGTSITSVAFSPEGSFFVTSGQDGSVVLWNAATQQILRSTLSTGGYTRGLAFSPGALRLAIPGEQGVRVWELAGGDRIESVPHRVNSVAVSRDAKWLAAAGRGSESGELTVYDRASMTPLGHARDKAEAKSGFGHVAFSPDGKRVVAADDFHSHIVVFDPKTCNVLSSFDDAHTAFSGFDLSPDGRQMLTLSDDFNGKVLVLRLRDVTTGEIVRTFDRRPFRYPDRAGGAQFSPDGTRVLAELPGMVRIWDRSSGDELASFATGDRLPAAAAFAPDGATVTVVSSDGFARVWSLSDKKPVAEFRLADGGARSARYTPDGSRLLTHGLDGVVRLSEPFTGQTLFDQRALGMGGELKAGVLSPDGRCMVLAQEGDLNDVVQVFNTEGFQKLSIRDLGSDRQFPLAIDSAAGRVAGLGADRQPRVWDVASGVELFAPSNPSAATTEMISALALSPDGATLLIGSPQGQVRAIDVKSGVNSREWTAHGGAVASIVFAADGRRVVTACRRDRTIKVWGLDGGLIRSVLDVPLFRAPSAAEVAEAARLAGALDHEDDTGLGKSKTRAKPPWDLLAFSLAVRPDGGQIAFAGESDQPGELYLLDLGDGGTPRRLQGHGSTVNVLAYNADGSRLLSCAGPAGGGSTEVIVWDTQAGRKAFELEGQADGVTAAAFSPDGKSLATGGPDQSLYIWDGQSGGFRSAFHGIGRAQPTSLRFVNGGKSLVSLHADGTVQNWDLPALAERAPSLDALTDLSASETAYADACLARQDTAHAREAFGEAMKYADEAVRRSPDDWRSRTRLADTHSEFAALAARENNLADARSHHSEAIRLWTALAEEFPMAPKAQHSLSRACQAAARFETEQFAFDAAADRQKVAVESYRQFLVLGEGRPEPQRGKALQRLERDLQIDRLAGRAVNDLAYALDQDPDVVPDLLALRITRLGSRGGHADLAETAARLAERYPEDATPLYNAACGYAQAVRAIEAGRKTADLPADDKLLRDGYADRAFDLLGRAARLGQDDSFRDDKDLDAIRGDKRFAMLLAGKGAELASEPSPGPNALRLKFREGETLRYVAEMRMAFEATAGGKSASSEISFTMDLHWRVDKVGADGSFGIVQQIDRIRVDVKTPNEEHLTFDTRDGVIPKDKTMEGMCSFFSRLAGLDFEMTIDGRGHMSSVHLPDRLIAMRAELPPVEAEQFSDDNIKKMAGFDTLPPFPLADPVKGTTWTGQTDTTRSALGAFASRVRYTYAGSEVRDGRTVDKLVGRMVGELVPDPKYPANAEMKIESSEITDYFDRERGLTVSTDMKAVMGFEITVGGSVTKQRITTSGGMRLVE